MKVLVADDDTVTRLRLKSLLEELSFEVIECANGKEAYEIMQNSDNPPPILILDWIMPEMDGIELCSRIRSTSDHLSAYIIMLTAKTSPEDLNLAFRAGVNDYLTKPFGHGELKARVQVGAKMIQLQKSLSLQGRQLYQSSKLATLGELASSVAHEINNPLNIIYGNVQRIQYELKNKNPDNSLIDQYCEKVFDTVNRISQITRSLLSVSHSKKETFEKHEIQKIVEMTMNMCKQKMNSYSIKFINELPASLPMVEIRANEISQVLINLFMNASHEIKDLNEKWIKISAEFDENFLTLVVTDSGRGIDVSIVENIMTPFFTTKKHGEGTGLGLSISKKIVDDHGGDLCLDTESKNTTFKIKLPLKQVTLSAEEISQVKIMIIDHNEDLLNMYQKDLTKLGLKGRYEKSATSAFKTLESWPADIILFDVDLIDMDTTEFISKLSKKHPSLENLFLTHEGPTSSLPKEKISALKIKDSFQKTSLLRKIPFLVESYCRDLKKGKKAA